MNINLNQFVKIKIINQINLFFLKVVIKFKFEKMNIEIIFKFKKKTLHQAWRAGLSRISNHDQVENNKDDN